MCFLLALLALGSLYSSERSSDIFTLMRSDKVGMIIVLQITATTGLAAVNIGGRTLHSWAGIGLGNGTVPQLLSKLRASHKKWKSGSIEDKKFARLASDTELFDELFVRDKVTTTAIERWRLTRVLIIDEGKT